MNVFISVSISLYKTCAEFQTIMITFLSYQHNNKKERPLLVTLPKQSMKKNHLSFGLNEKAAFRFRENVRKAKTRKKIHWINKNPDKKDCAYKQTPKPKWRALELI